MSILPLIPSFNRNVAIKLLRAQDDEELQLRFAREASAAASLSHPNIITIYDVGEHADQPFIAMEYVEGETLAQLIGRRQPLSLSRKLDIIEGIARGVEDAHRKGLVHRDLKPANVIIDPDGVVKILDFGIARRIEAASITSEGRRSGHRATCLQSS